MPTRKHPIDDLTLWTILAVIAALILMGQYAWTCRDGCWVLPEPPAEEGGTVIILVP